MISKTSSIAFLVSSPSAVALQIVSLNSQIIKFLYENRQVYRIQQLYWAPDGRHILITTREDVAPYKDALVAVDVSSGKPQVIYEQTDVEAGRTKAPDAMSGLQPLGWSHTGRYIGLISTERQVYQLIVLDQDRGTVAVYPKTDGYLSATWSNVADTLLLGHSPHNPLLIGALPPQIDELSIVDAATLKIEKSISRAGGYGVNPAWTTSGDKVAFWSGLTTICVLDLGTNNEDCPFYRLPLGATAATVEGEASPLAWSPDGTKLAFSIFEPQSQPVGYVLDLASNAVARSKTLYGFLYWRPTAK